MSPCCQFLAICHLHQLRPGISADGMVPNALRDDADITKQAARQSSSRRRGFLHDTVGRKKPEVDNGPRRLTHAYSPHGDEVLPCQVRATIAVR
ncbi:hypothetical protein IE81DRAFT_148003 [Ceraceosorus guamensis]|uniref:Uncharacterized protein n=1 Tax=Ceraceosorus guamensis TaxID=1522189 RepID=A0A316VYF0_9BASI|nr:hypothetical protein IE81DRAFT_148003 [Ceraceosorus guamensis]PWN41938.1 hypothetical protein IE81DRAFT_148003 [Ceraceosorus guamensis]